MATVGPTHEFRTAEEPREQGLHAVIVANIKEVNDNVRLLRLFPVINRTIKFTPGQWVDTFVPGIPSAGGFTLTSIPQQAVASDTSPPYLELAVQKSRNPPSKWLWQPSEDIIGSQIVVRVGGSFTWPPPHLDVQKIDRLVLIAGGVGINPLISIFTHLMRSSSRPKEVHFLYATKSEPDLDPQKILFLPRLMDIVSMAEDSNVTLSLFVTGTDSEGAIEHGKLPNRTFGRRIAEEDVVRAIDGYKSRPADVEGHRASTLSYVCGPPQMTDHFVKLLKSQPGMSEDRVLCEKWW
ncbi:related to NADH-cytochrome b-5 reductase [Ramularia collo-cygni]|uniref:Related to NADH-cytochrome b-5 reductase n=1 Tax=Ramularia collo-cygni TaxID=112498 RepID=A0A2D3V5S2_9PEZI|nr:related to NADH-cytochrome b-5 reductase [Ramularia collo-cygni]CZT16829.1 related to NADH-cytochrome b-5 reductase [Ramularia collo-cygni]